MWHTLFCVVYLAYTLNNAADSLKYYSESLIHSDFRIGTGFVIFFTSLFSKYLNLSYVGLLAFYGALIR